MTAASPDRPSADVTISADEARALRDAAVAEFPFIVDYDGKCFGCARSEIRQEHGIGAGKAYEQWWNARFLLGGDSDA